MGVEKTQEQIQKRIKDRSNEIIVFAVLQLLFSIAGYLVYPTSEVLISTLIGIIVIILPQIVLGYKIRKNHLLSAQLLKYMGITLMLLAIIMFVLGRGVIGLAAFVILYLANDAEAHIKKLA